MLFCTDYQNNSQYKEAHLISQHSTRCNYSATVLDTLGFNVVLHKPVSFVHAQNKLNKWPHFANISNNIKREKTKALSNELTQQKIWNNLPKSNTFGYVFEDDIEFPKYNIIDVPKMLNYVETLPGDLIYLGWGFTQWGEPQWNKIPNSSSLYYRKCSTFLAHAYGVRSIIATQLIYLMDEIGERKSHRYWRTNWDVLMKGYYLYKEKNKSKWPTCLAFHDGNYFTPIINQNRTRFKSTISNRM